MSLHGGTPRSDGELVRRNRRLPSDSPVRRGRHGLSAQDLAVCEQLLAQPAVVHVWDAAVSIHRKHGRGSRALPQDREHRFHANWSSNDDYRTVGNWGTRAFMDGPDHGSLFT